MLNVLIVGGGGREHALAWKLLQSPEIDHLYIAPGNAGTAHLGTNVNIAATDIRGFADFAEKHKIDLTIVGPDQPLADGITDEFRRRNLNIFGPNQRAACIEYSKAFGTEVTCAKRIPAASARVFETHAMAFDYLHRPDTKFPLVVKANGLARGKGVFICQTIDEADKAIDLLMLKRMHGEAGRVIVIEEFLRGREVSAHALSDGKTSLLFPPSRDYKRALDGDAGKNTGGMGAYAPVSDIPDAMMKIIGTHIVIPTLAALKESNRPFIGCLYPGLMITEEGPKVLEFNARFGDPEAQVYMRLLETDLLEVLSACVKGALNSLTLKWRPGYAVCVVLASEGYPEKSEVGRIITGMEEAEKIPDVEIFHAGTVLSDDGALRTAGGRVLNVTAVGETLADAVGKAYTAAELIRFDGMHYRRDIGAHE